MKQVGWSEKETIKFETEGDDGINYACFNTSWLTSDSDISDSEGNQVALISKGQAKVRHSAYNLLIQIIKVSGFALKNQNYENL